MSFTCSHQTHSEESIKAFNCSLVTKKGSNSPMCLLQPRSASEITPPEAPSCLHWVLGGRFACRSHRLACLARGSDPRYAHYTFYTNDKLRGSGEGWARVFLARPMNRSFAGVCNHLP